MKRLINEDVLRQEYEAIKQHLDDTANEKDYCNVILKDSYVKQLEKQYENVLARKNIGKMNDIKEQLTNRIVYLAEQYCKKHYQQLTLEDVINKLPKEKHTILREQLALVLMCDNIMSGALVEVHEIMGSLGFLPTDLDNIKKHAEPIRKTVNTLLGALSEKREDRFEYYCNKTIPLMLTKIRKYESEA